MSFRIKQRTQTIQSIKTRLKTKFESKKKIFSHPDESQEYEDSNKNSQKILQSVKKFNLDEIHENQFFVNFFKFLFSQECNFKHTLHFYDCIVKYQKSIEKYINFFPSIEFKFLQDHFFIKHIEVNDIIHMIKNSTFTPSPRFFAQSIKNHFQIQPFITVFTDKKKSKSEKEKIMNDLFIDLSETNKYLSHIKLFTISDFEIIKDRMEKYKTSFFYELSHHSKKRYLVVIDKKGNKIHIPRRKSKITTKKKNLNIHRYQDPIISVLRPWIKYDKMYIRCLDESNCHFYNLSVTIQYKNNLYYEPSWEFHKEYIKKQGKQKDTIYIMDSSDTKYDKISFEILYTLKDHFWLQDEDTYMKQSQWDNYTVYPYCIKHINNVVPHYKIQKYLVNILNHHFRGILHPNFNSEKIIKIIMDSLEKKNLSVMDKCIKIFNIIGRCSGFLSQYHGSFLSKINNNYLFFDKLIDAPHEILWPELFFYSSSDQKILLDNWDQSAVQFYYFIMKLYLKEEYFLRFYYKENHPTFSVCTMDVPDLCDYIYENGHKICLKDFNEDDPHSYLDFNYIANGLDLIDICVEAPIYWIRSLTNNENKQEIIETKKEIIKIEDLYNFLQKIENDEIKFLPHEEDDQAYVIDDDLNEEQKENERDEDDNLDDEIIDIDEFFGSEGDE